MDGHTIHFDLKEEQGRIIDRTFYIANPDEQVSTLANKIDGMRPWMKSAKRWPAS